MIAFGLLVAPRSASAQFCMFTATPTVAFGTYDPLGASPTDTVATVSWFCFPNSPLVLIESGSCSSDFRNRCMQGPTDRLGYNLFQDANHARIWGNTRATGQQPSGLWGNLTIYGRIPAKQDVGAGSYSDKVTITLQL